MWFNRIAVAEPAVKITRAWGCFYAPVESSCGFDQNIFSIDHGVWPIFNIRLQHVD